MITKTYSAAVMGIDGYIIDVECYIDNGFQGFDIIGLPDTAVRESCSRIHAAIKNSGYDFPDNSITGKSCAGGHSEAGYGIRSCDIRISHEEQPDTGVRHLKNVLCRRNISQRRAALHRRSAFDVSCGESGRVYRNIRSGGKRKRGGDSRRHRRLRHKQHSRAYRPSFRSRSRFLRRRLTPTHFSCSPTTVCRIFRT